jgi:hypothetical protein
MQKSGKVSTVPGTNQVKVRVLVGGSEEVFGTLDQSLVWQLNTLKYAWHEEKKQRIGQEFLSSRIGHVYVLGTSKLARGRHVLETNQQDTSQAMCKETSKWSTRVTPLPSFSFFWRSSRRNIRLAREVHARLSASLCPQTFMMRDTLHYIPNPRSHCQQTRQAIPAPPIGTPITQQTQPI